MAIDDNGVQIEIKSSILFFKYFFIFLIVPIVGTLMHEFGHYIIAIGLGYDSRISYAYTHTNIDRNSEPFHGFLITLGGPLATWLQCIIPFLYLMKRYNKETRSGFSEDLPPLFTMLLAFTSLCVRFIGIFAGFIRNPSGKSTDEVKLALYLNLYPGFFAILFGLIAIVILFYTLLILLPQSLRKILILSCTSGAIVGYILWYYYLGPILMPVAPYN